MGWISDLFSDDDAPRGRTAPEDPVSRARQLRRGVGRAAAALEDRHPALARSADEAAGVLVGSLPDDVDRELARDAVGRLDRLHFDLLQVDVAGMTPDEAGLEEDVEAVRELADRAPGRSEPLPDTPPGAESAHGPLDQGPAP